MIKNYYYCLQERKEISMNNSITPIMKQFDELLIEKNHRCYDSFKKENKTNSILEYSKKSDNYIPIEELFLMLEKIIIVQRLQNSPFKIKKYYDGKGETDHPVDKDRMKVIPDIVDIMIKGEDPITKKIII
nr:MAG TPA: hypothetical protein [Caudoviricetes sp.]